MQEQSWLCPTEADRGRVVDASARVRIIRMVGIGSVGLALLSAEPWFGWWTFVLLGLAVLNFVNVELRMRTSTKPERVSACAIVITMLLIAAGVVLSGGPASPALPWLVLPAAMAAARFRAQVVIAALALTMLVILGSTLAVDPAATIAKPVSVITTLALLAAVVSIVLALQSAELHHRDEAILDPLTGLLNRHALAPRFAELSVQARVNNQPVCLMLCDVDNFKAVNDAHGHDQGDAVLRDVAYALRTQLRSFELVYRLGGEEFLVVLPGASLEKGVEVAERLRGAVEQTMPASIRVTISLGVSAASGQHVSYDELFKAADTALYEAKRTGRNRAVAAPPLAADDEQAGTWANAPPGPERAPQRSPINAIPGFQTTRTG
ncbi:MAG TPA: diguanylate cyclase [Solirubrobacteraceae bacterium]|jgi:diguanylate cyclase (GGDEF)-like protein|nr:diguanylate cyclase [Solirubrobacteraceae bacterium]